MCLKDSLKPQNIVLMLAPFFLIKILEAIVFIITSLVCLFVAFITQNKPNVSVITNDKINKRLQMLEYMAKRRMCKMNNLTLKK